MPRLPPGGAAPPLLPVHGRGSSVVKGRASQGGSGVSPCRRNGHPCLLMDLSRLVPIAQRIHRECVGITDCHKAQPRHTRPSMARHSRPSKCAGARARCRRRYPAAGICFSPRRCSKRPGCARRPVSLAWRDIARQLKMLQGHACKKCRLIWETRSVVRARVRANKVAARRVPRSSMISIDARGTLMH